MGYIKHSVYSILLEALKMSPVVFLNGPRQAAKSTLVQNIRPQIGVNMDVPF